MPPTKTAQAQKIRVAEQLMQCKKCGAVMIQRKIMEKNGSADGKGKMLSILQCIVCRHWVQLDNF